MKKKFEKENWTEPRNVKKRGLKETRNVTRKEIVNVIGRETENVTERESGIAKK